MNRGSEVEKEERLWGLQRRLPPLSTFSLQISGGENKKRELVPTAAKGQGQGDRGCECPSVAEGKKRLICHSGMRFDQGAGS